MPSRCAATQTPVAALPMEIDAATSCRKGDYDIQKDGAHSRVSDTRHHG